MPRYFIEVSYNGTAFHGSQIQGDTPTVQYELNKALSILLRRPVDTWGASRTDEGVHASCNFYHADMEEALTPRHIYSLNAILPASMSVNQIYIPQKQDANARFDATMRQYRYRIYHRKNPFLFERAYHFPYQYDPEILKQTAAILMQYTDFESFSKRNAQTKTYKCTLSRSEWEQHGSELHYVVWGNRFLRGMVRALVGTQLRVARGKHDLSAFRAIIESRDCNRVDFSVPGFGLYLEKVVYPEELLLPVS
ncbi:MAG: tRNA pseudouridine synthase A [Chitinophagaceae bacterium]